MDTPPRLSHADLERSLANLGTRLRYPPVSDLAGPVRRHLERRPRPRLSVRALVLRRAIVYPVLAALAVFGSVLVFSPAARSAVVSWFGITGVQIETGHLPPGPLGRGLDLGQRTTLAAAQTSVTFHILEPTLPDLASPDEVYVGMPPIEGSVSLVYAARRGLSRSSITGAGLLITEFRRMYFDSKLIPFGASVTQVSIRGSLGVWLSGTPHVFYYVDESGRKLRETARLAGNTLIWQEDGLTLRMEGRISEARAIAIAEAMTPAEDH